MTAQLDFRAFILRGHVLHFYRSALKTARRAPAHAREELRQTIREEMEKNKYCEDKSKIRFLLSEGLQRLKELNDMLDIQGHG
ncbi:hypothetical protein SUGI_0627530 [Cryptomeria japonica]|uniref:uncharacterized protein LOC131039229 n=1 Tax=Cryptomeria japonica TaxID=3369 RepID=UPI002414768A|nr:uncharacterized protein LOC131039229 [Cryptomeria japonica]XP_057827925.1 uncharacterized protein LOC131039229 [Cryptomeria japonica]XP_057827931.1 uncharacterized protein LOC131039229 [Cryptomeria japonica]GLJ31281.1 hypothetical protein SUGI_0627530 [Cryptomeria japonica]